MGGVGPHFFKGSQVTPPSSPISSVLFTTAIPKTSHMRRPQQYCRTSSQFLLTLHLTLWPEVIQHAQSKLEQTERQSNPHIIRENPFLRILKQSSAFGTTEGTL